MANSDDHPFDDNFLEGCRRHSRASDANPGPGWLLTSHTSIWSGHICLSEGYIPQTVRRDYKDGELLRIIEDGRVLFEADPKKDV